MNTHISFKVVLGNNFEVAFPDTTTKELFFVSIGLVVDLFPRVPLLIECSIKS